MNVKLVSSAGDNGVGVSSIVRTVWSGDEETTLLFAQARLGNKWSEIAQELPGRNANMCKKRFARLQAAAGLPPRHPGAAGGGGAGVVVHVNYFC